MVRPAGRCRPHARVQSMKTRTSILLIFLGLLFVLLAQGQQLSVQSDTGKAVTLSRADIESLTHSKITTGSGDSQASYDVVPLRAVLEKAGVTFGESMRGKRLASCLLVQAADGYAVVIALPELDPAFSDKQIDLAYLRDGKPLDAKEGPYRIVIPDEKRMARWVRQVTALKIVEVQ